MVSDPMNSALHPAMNPQRWQEVGRLYEAARECDPDKRAAYLAAACGADEALHREVVSLLAFDEQPANILSGPAWQVMAREISEAETVAPPVAPPSSIGVYHLLAPLGRGGMGEVHLAFDTRLQRKVALKLLTSTAASDQARLHRFTQEARAASALNHPNILVIHDIGEFTQAERTLHYFVTEYVEGETLRQRMNAPLPVTEALAIALQIAAALAAAHEAGIVHRDIKPENVMLRRDGLVKVLDFGLAKLTEAGSRKSEVGSQKHESATPLPNDVNLPTSTVSGWVMGTPRYMSPEQAHGENVDTRTDLFSLGVLLYEMVTGRPPFTGETPREVVSAILHDAPPPLRELLPDAPAALERILERALRKPREERYQTIQEFAAELSSLQRELDPASATISGKSGGLKLSALATSQTNAQRSFASSARRGFVLVGVCVLLLGASWWLWRTAKMRQARALVPRIAELAQAERYFEAYDLAQTVRAWLPNEPTLTRLLPLVTDQLTVSSQPPGARVYVQRFQPDSANGQAARQYIGLTPLKDYQLARGGYVLTVEKEGYERFERTVTGLNLHIQGLSLPSFPTKVNVQLIESSQAQPRMVLIPGGEYRLASWDRPTDQVMQLDDYFIDKYEVSNREYKEFITAGGYEKREYWRHPISQDGRVLTWEAALNEFKDRTGLPAPRSWSNQNFPEGQAEHPVTDLSWYEAAAYAAFRGKELPTVYQWEKAARSVLERGQAGYFLMPWGPYTGTSVMRANFSSQSTVPVDSMPFGQSSYGCYHMAGNVAEWCRNASAEAAGSFAVTGGSFADPPYLFGRYGPYPGTFAASKLGFRCVRAAAATKGDQGAQALFAKTDIPQYQPVSDATFASWQNVYDYEHTPLEPKIVEVKETPDWRREKVTFNSNGERVIAYLYLPKNVPPPYQLLQFLPGDDAYQGWRAVNERVEATMAPHIKAGRAVLAVVLPGFLERRPPDFSVPQSNMQEYRDFVVGQATDARRALDYALTRPDLDASRVACFILSAGPGRKILLAAVEPRYRAVVMVGAGFYRSNALVFPEINPVNLAPRIHPPKLVVEGRYDENMTIRTDAEPFLRLLREPKRIVWFEGGHVPAPEIGVPPVQAWLDETLGQVRQP